MKRNIACIAIVVEDYDKAIEFYTKKLQFDLVEDTKLSDTKRWVRVAPKGSSACSLLLAKAANEEQLNRVGNQTGGRVFLFLHTTEFDTDFQFLLHHQIEIIRQPVQETWGRVCVFADLYGNLWDMIEVKEDK